LITSVWMKLYMLSILLDVYEIFRWSREPNRSYWGAYIDSKSNRTIGEKAIRKSNYAGQTCDAPLSNAGLTDECIFSAPKLAVRDQPMISLKHISLTDEHCWLELRKMFFIEINRRLHLYYRFKQWTHPIALCQWKCTDVLSFRHIGFPGACNVSVFEIFA
jgi:hypothetical protein